MSYTHYMKKVLVSISIIAIVVIGVVLTSLFFTKPESITTKDISLPQKTNNTSCAVISSANKVYCFGGRDGNIDYDSIIEYDLTKKVLETKSTKLPAPTFGHSCVEDSGSNKIYCFGGYSPSFSSAIFEYNPQDGDLRTKSAYLPKGTGGISCAEFPENHKIYCFGGFTGESIPGPLTEGSYGEGIYRNAFVMSSQITEYDPSTDAIAVKKSVFPDGRDDTSCVYSVKTQKIYCFGGGNADSAFDQILEYDPSVDKLAIKEAKLPAKMEILSCAENSNNKIYCFGGKTIRADQSSILYNKISEYDPVADRLVTRPITLPVAIGGLQCVKDSSTPNNILCFGGWAEKSSDLIFEYYRGNKIYQIIEFIKKFKPVLPTWLEKAFQFGSGSSDTVYDMYCVSPIKIPLEQSVNAVSESASQLFIDKLYESSLEDLTSNLKNKIYINSEIPTALAHMGVKLIQADQFDDALAFLQCDAEKYYHSRSMYMLAQVYKHGSADYFPGSVMKTKIEPDLKQSYFWIAALMHIESIENNGLLDMSDSGWSIIGLLDSLQNDSSLSDNALLTKEQEAISFVGKRYPEVLNGEASVYAHSMRAMIPALENPGTIKKESNKPPTEPITPNIVVGAYVNKTHGLSMRVPTGWAFDESNAYTVSGGLVGSIGTFYDPKIGRGSDNASAPDIWIHFGSANGADLDTITTDFPIESKKVMILKNGLQAEIIVWTYTDQKRGPRKLLKLNVIKNDILYSVVGESLESDWVKYGKLIESSVLTFDFI